MAGHAAQQIAEPGEGIDSRELAGSAKSPEHGTVLADGSLLKKTQFLRTDRMPRSARWAALFSNREFVIAAIAGQRRAVLNHPFLKRVRHPWLAALIAKARSRMTS